MEIASPKGLQCTVCDKEEAPVVPGSRYANEARSGQSVACGYVEHIDEYK